MVTFQARQKKKEGEKDHEMQFPERTDGKNKIYGKEQNMGFLRIGDHIRT